MEQHEVVPDVVDTVPSKKVEVVYPSGAAVEMGNVLTPTQVKDVPKITWDAESNQHYVVCMTGQYKQNDGSEILKQFNI
ncbi:unnamed protein product [Acanthoscelides obtectus]|uniref:Uncharacterized protein n=1 Tax=Acanthoscelides obtectus TaxID=200917 RepID=A0A9P0P730_ACAOB|nr:unnamed protein product [Acanthoscelides obtectus]CAK1667486.1 Phosphatidylethanolamine-binding protein homolog F40A3.3 [Acanthoscelides obtectus]